MSDGEIETARESLREARLDERAVLNTAIEYLRVVGEHGDRFAHDIVELHDRRRDRTRCESINVKTLVTERNHSPIKDVDY